nr:hypothetical protein [Tanacetum cinerariifolium]
MAYRAVPYALDEYLQMGATTIRKSLQMFCKGILELYGEEFLRNRTYTDMEKLYAYHEEKHGFPGMIGSIDCTDSPWENYPVVLRAQFARGDHEPDPFILLEAIASNDLWIWHVFFGVAGMNNGVNVLRQSPLFNDLKAGKAPDVPFVANNACSAVYEASKPKIQQTQIERDLYGAHNLLVAVYFSEHPHYEEATFHKQFQMSRKLFTQIVREVTDYSLFFNKQLIVREEMVFSSLMKCTSAIRQMAYGAIPDALDEILQMGATTTRVGISSLMKCTSVIRQMAYEAIPDALDEYLQIGVTTARMIGRIDFTDWSWENYPVALRAQFARGDQGLDPFILLEAIASNDLWIWHAFFGVAGMNNDVNVLRKSPLFNDLNQSGKINGCSIHG